ncbi:hypothetical protein QT970_28945 [Microcoleus sp. herbarium8]|uniref:hypothetical protein n=1 Tax=Microcoleus sp. herbarium8 TaxID=3055436 RepID=UPI002FCF841E
MDTITFARKVMSSLCHPLPGETVISFLRRYRKWTSPARWDYWQLILCIVRAEIRVLLKTPFWATFLSRAISGLLLVHVFVYADTGELALPVKKKVPKTNIVRGPPKRFIPIPDIEIGGCARNDSLIAPAI